MNLNFEKHKLLRFIKSQGRSYTFRGSGKNQFGEPMGEDKTVEISGIYHESQGYVTNTATDGSNIKSKPNSLIMCLKEDSSLLEFGMLVTIQDKKYRVVDLRDVNNLGVACDISLELVLS